MTAHNTIFSGCWILLVGRAVTAQHAEEPRRFAFDRLECKPPLGTSLATIWGRRIASNVHRHEFEHGMLDMGLARTFQRRAVTQEW